MTDFASAWKAAGEPEDDFDPKDGTYRCKLIDAGAFAARTDGREYVKLKWQIIGTDDAGRQFEDFQGVSHPTGLRITREKLELLGLKGDGIEDIDDLSLAIFDLIGAEADVVVKHKDGYRNATVSRVLTGQSDIPNPAGDHPKPEAKPATSFAAAAGGTGSGNGQADDDSIPF